MSKNSTKEQEQEKERKRIITHLYPPTRGERLEMESIPFISYDLGMRTHYQGSGETPLDLQKIKEWEKLKLIVKVKQKQELKPGNVLWFYNKKIVQAHRHGPFKHPLSVEELNV
jgi:hypothetical protein